MIVRINQIDVVRGEQEANWASEGMLGPVAYSWPADARAYNVLILDRDEQQQALPPQFLQTQMRLMIPQAIAALREPGEEIVIRLDGPMIERELLAGFRHLTDTDLTGRFAISEARKFEPAPQEVIGSMRVQPSPQACSRLCMDADLGLERSVRLRAFSVPDELVNPLLDISDPTDDRWKEILPRTGMVLSTERGLRGLQVISRRLGPPELKQRLMQRLLSVARESTPASV